MSYELHEAAIAALVHGVDAADDATDDRDPDDPICDGGPLTGFECVREAREILAEWDGAEFLDPLLLRDIGDACDLLSRALVSGYLEVHDL